MSKQEPPKLTRATTTLRPATSDDEITITLHHLPCPDPTCSHQHPNIKPYTSTIHLNSQPIGHLTLYLFHKRSMSALSPNRMWEEPQAYDTHHAGAKLDKIENFLANESFSELGQERIDAAEIVLFIDRVWLEPKWRGKGRGLAAVRETVRALELPQRGIVMLQAGDGGGSMGVSAQDAGEKLTAHWRKLGFGEWSESDPAWLLLWLGDVYWV